MLNKLINRFLKPQFVGIAGVIFRRDEILSVGTTQDLKRILVVYRDERKGSIEIDLHSECAASYQLEMTAKQLGLKVVKKR